jgi:hypothetical protein
MSTRLEAAIVFLHAPVCVWTQALVSHFQNNARTIKSFSNIQQNSYGIHHAMQTSYPILTELNALQAHGNAELFSMRP